MNIESIFTIDRILGVLGIILTIILSFIGFKISKKEKKKRLIFLKVNKVSLFSNILKNFENIEIKYKDEKITDNLFYYSAKLFNDGDFDIDKNSFTKPFEIEFPENFICREFKITKKSKDVNIVILNINNNTVQLEWDLLKKGESFQFETLLEFKNNDQRIRNFDASSALDNNIKHNFRITNLDKIDLAELQSPTPVIGCGILTIMLISAFFFFSYFSFVPLIFPKYETYIKSTDVLKSELVKIESENETVLKLMNRNEDVLAIISPEHANKYLTTNYVIFKERFGFWKIFFAILASSYLVMAIVNVVSFYTDRNRKYR